MKPAKTLVVAPNWVGDNVMAFPVLEALARSNRTLTVLARPHLGPLLELLGAVDEFIARGRDDAGTIRELRSRAFEECVILPNSFRSAWLPFRARIPVRWGYRSDFRGPLLEPAVRGPADERHQIADYDALLERIGAGLPNSRPQLALSDDQLAAADVRLGLSGLEAAPATRLLGVFPGAEFGPSKRWPLEFFADLVSELHVKADARAVIIAGPGERDLASTARGDNPEIPIIGPDLDLAQLAAVLARLDVLVTNDSGPMHIADAAGTPCVALFGPTNPARTAPTGARSRVLYTNRWCSPCFRKRCPLFHQRCMRDLGVGAVLSAVNEILGAC